MPVYVVTGTLEVWWSARQSAVTEYSVEVEADSEAMAVAAAVQLAGEEADVPHGFVDWEVENASSVGQPVVELLANPEARAAYEAERAYKQMRAARVPTLFELAAAD